MENKSKAVLFLENLWGDVPEQARESGRRAGKASKNRDQGSVSFEKNWFQKFRSLHSNTKEEERELQKAYDDGYKETSGFGRPPVYLR